jgi:hypothetical protein
LNVEVSYYSDPAFTIKVGRKFMLIRARRSGIALALVSVSAAAASAAPSGAGAATRVPVLGKYRLFPSPSVGFGTYKPARIYNGGGMVDSVNDITWSRWGTKLAHGVGHAPELRPSGGYYAREARIKLHAFSLGRCRPRGRWRTGSSGSPSRYVQARRVTRSGGRG